MEQHLPAKLENFKPLFQKHVYEAMEFDKLLLEAYYQNNQKTAVNTQQFKN
ncbi:MAG: hypothetical protein ACKVOA_10190 [Methylophilaceae bacterium]